MGMRLPRGTKPVAPLEKEVQRAVLDYLTVLGAFRVRVNSGGIRATYKGRTRFVRFNDSEGCPDILCCLGGRFIGIECKRPGGKATSSQEAALDAIRHAGGVSFIADSIDAVKRSLQAEGLISQD